MDKYFPLVYLLLSFVAICQSLPQGAPRSICYSPTLTPEHPPFLPQTGPAPYKILTNQLGDGRVDVVILPKKAGVIIKGFVINAINNNNEVTGTFVNAPKTIDCVNAQDTATHESATAKFAVPLGWAATVPGPVTFRATVVQEYSTFYVGIKSNKVHVQ